MLFHRFNTLGPSPQVTAWLALMAVALIELGGCVRLPQQPCAPLSYGGTDYVLCSFNAGESDLRVFLNGPDGAPYRQFDALSDTLDARGETLVFAMNAGMYLPDRSPVGLLVEDGEEHTRLNLADGDSNFTLKPNGVFWIGDSDAGVLESEAYAASDLSPRFATQSGPMLVIDGELHPAFNADGTSRYRRNGVGVSDGGQMVHFLISDVPVNFHTFARVFRDRLETPNALYFDGRVSLLYAPNLARVERGADMGPIVGVVTEETD